MKKAVFRLVLFLVVAGASGLIGFAYLGDLEPEQRITRQPVMLDVD